MFVFGKNKQLMEKLEEYFKIAEETMGVFSETMEYMLDKKMDEHFELLAQKTARNESDADDTRRQIESEMYEKSLLPETREDILLIIELIDAIPSQAKRVTTLFVAQRTKPVKEIQKELLELTRLTVEGFAQVLGATRACVGKPKTIREFSRRIDNDESLGDSLERGMIGKIFESNLDAGEKLIQRDIVQQIGSLLDLCERAIDRIVILNIKRHI